MFRILILICCLNTLQLPAQTKQIQYLSGTGNNNTIPWDFFCTAGRNSGQWTTIPVPSCWELEGFGNYNYGRDYKTYGKNFRFFDEKGMYKRSFQIPAAESIHRPNQHRASRTFDALHGLLRVEDRSLELLGIRGKHRGDG